MKESDRLYNYARNSLNKFTFEKIVHPLHNALAREIEGKYKAKSEGLLKLYMAKVKSKCMDKKVTLSDSVEYVPLEDVKKAIADSFEEIKIEMTNF